MKIRTMMKGAAMMAAVGTACYLYNNASPASKRKVKRTAGKALHSLEDAYRKW